jgi:hypothetical protein
LHEPRDGRQLSAPQDKHTARGAANAGGTASVRRSYHDKLLDLLGMPAGARSRRFTISCAAGQMSERHRLTAAYCTPVMG